MPVPIITVLIVEDDPFLLSMYSTKFELEGFKVVTAEDGEKGVARVRDSGPSIILLDILMPKMDGFEVLEKIKSDPFSRDIPVILLTNLNQQEDVKRGMELGADDYLIKAHFMPSEVVDKIKKILNIQT